MLSAKVSQARVMKLPSTVQQLGDTAGSES